MKINVGQTIAISANVGVLIGLILLLLELDQSSTMVRGQTRNDVASELIGLMSQVAGDPELSDLLHRAEIGAELTPEEMQRFNHRQIAMFRYFENVYYQYSLGLYDEAEFAAQKEAWRDYGEPARNKFWCQYQHTLSPSFREEMAALIVPNGC